MDVLAAMAQPSTYPHPVGPIRHLETHISHVYLTGDFAYKLKKPLQNPFLDYRTLEARKRYCNQELDLNRRFAPDLYLEVVAIARDRAGWNLEGRGEVCEYAVRMREFSQDALLLTQLRAGLLSEKQMRSLGAELARIHQAAPRLGELASPFGTAAQVAQDSLDNVTALQHLVPAGMRELVETLAGRIDRQGQCLKQVIADRRAAGLVRECHGDLHLGNLIWHAGRVQLFDGIEFNEAFRWIDVMSDLAFVLMDLEEHQQAGLANLLLNVYLEESGDFDGLRVLTFYKVYRAMVRAKVAALRAGQQVAGEQQRCWEEVGTYLDYAKSALELRCPSLVMTHGVSGSGKTYQTEPLLHQPGVIRIRSDVERKRMEELNGAARVACKPGEGLYSAANKNAVYEHLRQLAEVVLRAGWTVVLDATFLLAENRLPFFQLATQLHVPIKILHFEAAEKVLRARLQERGQRGDDASDAGWDVLQAQLRAYQPLSTSELAVCTTVERLQHELAGASPT